MFETSLQAKIIVPMAVALGFAVLYATLVTLILVPCLYMILEDFKALFITLFKFIGRVFSRKGRNTGPTDTTHSEA
jgi:Cu/Ag efflux pump CusA